jgi:hypothetical protein
MGSLCRNVYDWPGSGDKYTNNGQEWPGIENLDKEWKTGRKVHKKCEEELDAEWNTRVANETRTASNSLGEKNPFSIGVPANWPSLNGCNGFNIDPVR